MKDFTKPLSGVDPEEANKLRVINVIHRAALHLAASVIGLE